MEIMTPNIGNTRNLLGAGFLFVLIALFQPAVASAQLSAYGAIAVNDYGFLHDGTTAFKSDTEGIVACVSITSLRRVGGSLALMVAALSALGHGAGESGM